MKWLFDLFKDKEAEHIVGGQDSKPEHFENVPVRKGRSDRGGEMETRISYQYPKGEFRFPLIPDDDHRVRKKRPPFVEKERKHEKEVPIHLSKIKVEPVDKPKKMNLETRNTRPFKPTEIPSPIYGFKGKPETPRIPLKVEYKEKEEDIKVTSIYQSKQRDQQPFYEKSKTGMVLEEQNNQQEEKDQEIRKLQKIETEETYAESIYTPSIAMKVEPKMSAAVETYQMPIMEEKMEEPEALQRIKEVEKEPEVLELVEEVEKEPEVLELVEEVEKEPEVLELVEEAEKEPEVLELVEEAEKKPEVLELVEEAEKKPEVLELVEEAEKKPEVLELVEEAEKEPEVLELVEEAEKESEVLELVEEAEKESEVLELVEEAEKEPKVLELVEGASQLVEQVSDETNEQFVESYVESETNSSFTPIKEEPVVSRSAIPFNVIMLNHDKRKLPEQRKSTSNPRMFVQNENPKPSLVEQKNELSYEFPSFHLLTPPAIVEDNGSWIGELKEILDKTLENFNVGARVVNVTQGPAVTRFEVQPEPGVKVNKITNLVDDIKLSFAARDIRMEAPIPGKHTIGIEVPNQKSRPVFLSEIVNNPEFSRQESPLTAALGLDISGKPIVTDLRKMPHGLIAGATGSGKSVCINTILVSLLYKARPEELKLLLIDPKMVEFAPYNRIPHLVSPVITDVKAATAALKWAVEEMERRYELFAHTGVRDISRFNELAEKHKRYSDKLPYIVIVIDELADLMMMSPADVEEAICRIAQKARACGIHLIIATQRPSVDVITGLIKANIPTRIAFSVSSQVDSRTIIDMSGAEKLLGRGDMLFLENGSSKPVRLQGTFVSDEEIDEVVAHVREQQNPIIYLSKRNC